MKSILECYNIKTGARTVLWEFDSHIEAPNWTKDGENIIYNSGGRLYKFSLADQTSELIDTGDAVRCNNDHLIAPDSSYIAISNSPAGKPSHVYTVPFEGGHARLVTPIGPSYLHGISPDGKTLAYCAERNGNFDIYTIPFEGGEEKRLTDAPGLDDGPEYSPSGRHIWFNSVRTGLMQIWRMKADGSDQTQMTFDTESNNWFPHVSPDGENVVFISYKKGDVAPGDHPANKNIEIRLMDHTGGQFITIIKAFGGQGTLNVNSWAPDSERFAFVTYKLD